MTHKQNKRYHNLNNKSDSSDIRMSYSAEDGGRSRRPILYSSDDVERMAVESSRARLMMQLVRKPEESSSEIGSNSRGKSAPTAALKQNFLTYSTLVQGLRWSPSIEIYSGDSQTETDDYNVMLNCSCHKCQMNKSAVRERQTTNINSSNFKENIVRYCDTSTMTRNLKDSGCGVRTPLSSTADINTSDVSISTSDAVKGVLKIRTPQMYTPAPILKKAELVKEMNHRVSINLDDAKCKRSDYEDLLKSYTKQPAISTPLCKNVNSDVQNSRKVLYNEGISNLIANNTMTNFPLRPKQIKSQIKLESSNQLNVSLRHFSGKNNGIPYTHRTKSKYHYDCKEPNHSYTGNIEEVLKSSPISPLLKKATKSNRTQFIKLPRRLLISE